MGTVRTATMAKILILKHEYENPNFYVAIIKRVHLDVYDVVHLDFYTL